jgi:hypothetical protein
LRSRRVFARRLRSAEIIAGSVDSQFGIFGTRLVPVGRTTLYRMETGRFPRSTYISPNRRVWFADQIVAWQKAVDEFNPNRGRGKGRHRVCLRLIRRIMSAFEGNPEDICSD